VIAAFLADHRPDDRKRRFVVKHGNDRSLHALRGALERLAWIEGQDYWIDDGRVATSVWVRSTSTA
jgi:hypothetical protein